MNKVYLFFCLITVAICSMETGYNTLYLLKFDNLKNDFPYSNMEYALPDLIKENYSFRQDLKIDYINNINPNIEKYTQAQNDSIKAIIINGRFQVLNNNFHIEYEAYDMDSWRQLLKRQFFCPLNDITCVHDAFLISMEDNLSPFLVDKLDVESTIVALEKAEKEALENANTNQDIENFEHNDLEDDIFFIEDKNFREFSVKNLNIGRFEKNDSLQNLSKILSQVLKNPYEVFIGDMEIEIDSINTESYKIELPIKYSMMNIVKQELLASLPLNSYLNTDEEVVFQFSNSDFVIDDYFKNNMVQTKFQKFPVIYFLNKLGQPEFIVIDSWFQKNQFKDVNIGSIPIFFINQFSPLFSITSGIEIVELAISTRFIELKYNLSILNENLGDYIKVVVKFIHRNEIEKILE